MDDKSIVRLTITEEDTQNFKRLDQFLNHKLPDYSRSLLKKLFEDGHIKSDKKIELKKMPPIGSVINFKEPTFNQTDLIAENIPLSIIYEDEHLIFINKDAGMVVHPAPGNYTGTLVNAVLHHCPDLEGIGNEKRPGIVHRLDKGTSGVMVVAKNQKTHEGLVKLFSSHDINRYYEAICLSEKIPPQHTIKSLIGRNPHNRLKMSTKVKNGKHAHTELRVIEYFKNFSHLELRLETGRTHQIRVHLSEILNAPILNDEVYGREKEEKNAMSSSLKEIIKDYSYPLLHAKILGFKHPITQEYIEFQSEPPKIFKDIIQQFRLEMS